MFDMLPFDEHLKMLKEKYDRECKCSEYLREELNKVKDESFKDSELKKMKQELETMRKEYYRGFPISKSEEERIDEFMKKHNEIHGSYHGCSGGGFTYIFYPTAIGTSGVIRCDRCKEEFEFQKIGWDDF